MKIEDSTELIGKNGFKTEKKIKCLGIIMTNMDCMLFKMIYGKIWNKIKKDMPKWDYDYH